MKKSRKAMLIGLVVLALVAVPTAYSYQTYGASYSNNIQAVRSSLAVPLVSADFNEFMTAADKLSRLMTVEIKYVGWGYFSDYIENKPADKYELFFDRESKTIWAQDSFTGKQSMGLMRIYIYKHNDLDNFIKWLRVNLTLNEKPA